MTESGEPGAREAWQLGALLFALFALLSSGTTGSGDSMVRYRMARSLVNEGHLALEQPSSVTVEGRGGRPYAVYGVGQTLLFAVPEAAVSLARAAAGGDPAARVWSDVSVGISSVVLLPMISAVGLAFLFLLQLELGIGRRAALAATLLVAVGSPILVYAKYHQEENQLAALAFACAYCCVRLGRGGPAWHAAAAALLCWAPMWFRATALAVSLPLAGLVLLAAWRSGTTRSRAVGAAALFIAGAATASWLLFYNWYRFGDVFETGYQSIYRANGFLNGSLVQGLLGPFLHPSKSVLLYSPLLLVAAAGARFAWRDRWGRPLLLAGLAALALSVLLPAKLKMWGGDNSWGPRYQVAGHALLLVMVGYFAANWRGLARPSRAAAAAVATAAVAVQLLALPFDYNLEYNRGLRRSWDFQSIAEWYDVGRAQIPLRLDSLARFGGNLAAPPSSPASALEEYAVPALLPWKLGQRFGADVWAAALAAWIAAASIWAMLLVRFLVRARAPSTAGGDDREGVR